MVLDVPSDVPLHRFINWRVLKEQCCNPRLTYNLVSREKVSKKKKNVSDLLVA